jgi:tetratricopeptide (TPR) repeat protein
MGKHHVALAAAEEGLRLSRSLGLKTWQGEIHTTLRMMIALEQGELSNAAAAQEESLSLSQVTGNQQGISAALNYLGQIANLQGDHQRAVDLFNESLRIRRELGDRRGSTAMYANLSYAYTLAGEVEQARAHAVHALRLSNELDYQHGTIWGLVNMASVLVDAQPEAALRLLGAAERMLDEKGIRILISEQPEHDRVYTLARAALGDEAFDAAWAAGRALSLDAAVAEALAAV